MNNLRQLHKYWLSGGWQDINTDPAALEVLGIVAILDLQYTEDDVNSGMGEHVREACAEVGIEYEWIPMSDAEWYTDKDLDEFCETTDALLTDWESKYIKPGQYILVKCGAGISRSPFILINHLCKISGGTAYEQLIDIRDLEEGQASFGSSPNQRFQKYLNDKYPYEWDLRGWK